MVGSNKTVWKTVRQLISVTVFMFLFTSCSNREVPAAPVQTLPPMTTSVTTTPIDPTLADFAEADDFRATWETLFEGSPSETTPRFETFARCSRTGLPLPGVRLHQETVVPESSGWLTEFVAQLEETDHVVSSGSEGVFVSSPSSSWQISVIRLGDGTVTVTGTGEFNAQETYPEWMSSTPSSC